MATRKGNRTSGLRAFSLQPPSAELNHSLARLARPVRTLACPSYQPSKPTDPSTPRMDMVPNTIGPSTTGSCSGLTSRSPTSSWRISVSGRTGPRTRFAQVSRHSLPCSISAIGSQWAWRERNSLVGRRFVRLCVGICRVSRLSSVRPKSMPFLGRDYEVLSNTGKIESLVVYKGVGESPILALDFVVPYSVPQRCYTISKPLTGLQPIHTSPPANTASRFQITMCKTFHHHCVGPLDYDPMASGLFAFFHSNGEGIKTLPVSLLVSQVAGHIV